MSATRTNCSACGTETEYAHLHDAAHGIEGTHMVGSERYECLNCGDRLPRELALSQGWPFFLDDPVPARGEDS